MNSHELVWTFDRDDAQVELVCNDPNCQYRYACDKGCELIYEAEPYNGGFRHPAVEHEIGRVTLWHEMVRRDECNFALWINESGCAAELCAVSNDTFEIGRTPVEPEWLGEDGAEWKRVLPSSRGDAA